MRYFLFVWALSLSLICSAAAQSQDPEAASGRQSVPPYQSLTSTQEQDIHENLKDVHFAFDRYELTPDDRQTLESAANWLKANPNVYVTIGGDTDERGSIVYNLYLSHERAKTTRDTLISMGVSENQIVFATGWGKLYPVCNQSDESCWAENRRAHFEPWEAGSLAAFDIFRPSRTEAAGLTFDLLPPVR